MENYLKIPIWASEISSCILILALSLCLVQIMRSKSLFQKLLCLELMSSLVMCLAILFAITQSNPLYLELSLCISIIGFLGTVAFAQYLGRDKHDK